MDQHLEEILSTIRQYPNGERVARTMAEILKYALDPMNEALIPACTQLLEKIARSEEILLERNPLELHENGPILEAFRQAMYASSNAEWEEYLEQHDIKTRESITEAALTFSSSKVDMEQFKSWTMGDEVFFQDPETQAGTSIVANM